MLLYCDNNGAYLFHFRYNLVSLSLLLLLLHLLTTVYAVLDFAVFLPNISGPRYLLTQL